MYFRSRLYAPGSRPELFLKAMATETDAVTFDLEDAVMAERKGEARANVASFLQSAPARESAKRFIVRVNGLDTEHFTADIQAVALPGVGLIALPKLESADDVRQAAAALEKAERANGVSEPIRILANIETPKALRLALEIGTAHSRVAGLQIGFGDLFGAYGVNRDDAANAHAAMFAVRMAAAEAGVFAFDSVYTDVGNPQGFRAQAEIARRLGYMGKTCIHPSQVKITNDVFSPRPEEIRHALRVVEETARAKEKGWGAYVVDGKMVDGVLVTSAYELVKLARELGLIDAAAHP